MNSAGSIAVDCLEVSKAYGHGESRVVALRSITVTVHRGEILMLVGPSGCGKTTLISVIAGILDRDGGACTVLGQDFRRMKEAERTRFRGENIGFVFQTYNLIPTLTAAENVAVPLLILGRERRAALVTAQQALEAVGVGDRARAYPGELSGGQAQRVAIARAIVHQPRLIVCDEPTSALDHETGARVMEVLRAVAVGRERSLIIVTHDDRIFAYAHRIARMSDGRVLGVTAVAGGEEVL
ncbi:MAG: ABC transporter ATP-binding protein [Thermodesulfobacteriota bacterium]